MSMSDIYEKSTDKTSKLELAEMIRFLETMLRIRYFEEAVRTLSQQGLIGGAAHLYVGQEAIAAGACSAVTASDYITSTHRGHGHCIAKGGNIQKMMAEVMGKADGYCKGKGGSMHIADFSIGICGANGIVGGGLPISIGLGLSSLMKSERKVTLCFFGDGASNQGTFHETLNLASLWHLPVVYICENNGYAMTTTFRNGCCVTNIAQRAVSYNIPGKIVDGNDVLAVYGVVSEAVEYARNNAGPVLVECMTYRQSGHYAGDPCPYRTADEVRRWREENDPISRFKHHLIRNGLASPVEIAAIEDRVILETEKAVEVAKAAPIPDLAEVSRDVYSSLPVSFTACGIKLHDPGTRIITYRDALNEALSQIMELDKRVFLLGEDISFGAFRVTQGLIDKFGPKRVRNTPISESAIIGSAIGASVTGLLPVAEIMYIDFTTLAMDQIVNQAAKFCYMSGGNVNLPLVIRTPGGSGGRGNAAQHSQSLEAFFMHVPGLKVVVPSTPYDAKGLLISAINDPDPVIFIEHKMLYNTKGFVPEELYSIPFGLADIKREGSDVTIITYSRMLVYSLQAADVLSGQGIQAEIIDLRTLVPLDIDTVINSVKKTGRAVIVEEDCKTAGVGAELVALIDEHAFNYLDAPVMRIAGLDVPIPYAPILEKASVPSVESIVSGVINLLKG